MFRTKVTGNYLDIMKRFDRHLFLALAPKLAKIKLEAFTGSQTGDQVHIKFLAPIKTEWISDIIDHGSDEKRAYFVDKGVTLPFPLMFWEHRHVVEKINEHESYIVDDIHFKSYNWVMTALIYPGIWLGFSPRKRIYQAYFNN